MGFLLSYSPTTIHRGVEKFFGRLCRLFGMEHLTSTAHHPQTNGQGELYNRTMVARLHHCIAKHHSNGDLFVQPLAKNCNTQRAPQHRTYLFSLPLSRQPPRIITLATWTKLPTYTNAETLPKALRLRQLSTVAEQRHSLDKRTKVAQQQYKQLHDVQKQGKHASVSVRWNTWTSHSC